MEESPQLNNDVPGDVNTSTEIPQNYIDSSLEGFARILYDFVIALEKNAKIKKQ